jgi:hypothetical protein
LNRNIAAYKGTVLQEFAIANHSTNLFHTGRAQIFYFAFDEESFSMFCQYEPEEKVDLTILDMLLKSQARRQIRRLDVEVRYLSNFFFSSEALESFLAGNDRLKDLRFRFVQLADESCKILGRTLHILETLVLYNCELDVQALVDAL